MRQRIVGIVLLGVAAAVVAVLGIPALIGPDDSGENDAAGTDLTALMCPMVPTGEAAGVEQYEPAPDAFDTAELLGMDLNTAHDTAADHGCEIVVALRDGSGQPVPVEIDPTRIYVFVEDDVVTYIEGVGGGL